ncbi:MAG: zinc ribbon domain-containing protein [Longimicrobiales bacterium]|nr:zinc ribbon domain-containing protein [Longimicrobiales bacterium]
MSDDLLARFHGTLVEALRARGVRDLARPFTVAEIYQDLVPYAAYREALGVEMNGDYEHALLRLLAGEGEFVGLDSEHALREIREELESVNPNTGLYREFAAVDVRLNPEHLPELDVDTSAMRLMDGTAAEGEAGAEAGEDVAAGGWPTIDPDSPPSDRDYIQVVPLGAFAASGPLDPEMVEPDAVSPAMPVPETLEPEMMESEPTEAGPGAGNAAAVEGAHGPEVCAWCREVLPKRDRLNFCPFCGTDVKLVPCESCGEALEPEWRFCISCGTRAGED